DLSLVDPDNRRAVDHAANRESLQAMRAAATGERALPDLAGELIERMEDGRIKQFVIWRALELRRERAALFRDGAYVPLAVHGADADHLCAFARVRGSDCVVAVVSRLASTLMRGETLVPVGAEVWGDAQISLANLPPQREWRDAMTGASIDARRGNGLLGASAL